MTPAINASGKTYLTEGLRNSAQRIPNNYLKPCECGKCDVLIWHIDEKYRRRRFEHGHNNRNNPKFTKKGLRPPNYKGRTKCNGYILTHKPDHYFADVKGNIYEHRL